MKKLILVLAIALMAVPAWAVNVVLEQVDSDTLAVKYNSNTGVDRMRAVALVLDAPDGVTLTLDEGSYKTGESVALAKGGTPGYGIYPARITINTDGTVPTGGYGSPLAMEGDPGADLDDVVLEFGSLYFDDTNAPAAEGTLCTFTVAAGGVSNPTITMVDEDTYRGGLVLEDGTQGVVNTSIVFTTAEPECMKNTAAGYNNWVAAGKPDCWCYQYQGLGDIDGKEQGSGMTLKRIGGVDLTKFVAGFNKKRNLLTGELICADIDHLDQGSGMTLKAVGGVDLAIFVANYNKKTSQLPDPVPYAADYNFWKVAP